MTDNAPPPPRLRQMLEELAGVWELQAEMEADTKPGRRETLRETADALRMLLDLTRGDGTVPGKMHCARCKFSLQRVNLHVNTGQVSAGGTETEPCPNGCGPLWAVSWEQEAREGWRIAEGLFERAHAAEQRLARLAPAPVLVSGASDVGPENQHQVDEAALARLHANGAKAWADVPNATQWVEEMRGNVLGAEGE